jgi:L-2-hydroxyglutarate oxidase LhgO
MTDGVHQDRTPVADVAVIGGGIVGLATAREWLARDPGASLVLFEKEPQWAQHQTGHNSSVIHSGVYYKPGSLKARLCVAGARLMKQFCQVQGIPVQVPGKVIVATRAEELPVLEMLHQRGVANGVEGLSVIGPERLRELEPHARGLKALRVAGAGLVDYGAVARTYAALIQRMGGRLRLGRTVTRIESRDGEWIVHAGQEVVRARYLIACAGLHSDRVASMAGVPRDVQIVPFRGEYYDVTPSRTHLVRSMIYPVPDPGMPFLGVHFTRTVAGGVHAGPNAVLAWAREGYRRRDVQPRDLADLASFGGFWRMAARHWRVGAGEWYRSLYKPAFVAALQRLVPDIRAEDLVPGGAGVRAQAVNHEGALLDDFNIVHRGRAIYVRNVPSPAATASLAIAGAILDMAAEAFSLPPRLRAAVSSPSVTAI